jgi:actin-binding LIM protein
VKIVIPSRRRGMDILVNACITQSRENGQHFAFSSGRRSPHMNNEEPITLSTYPDARPSSPTEAPKIERDDFPAPPYPYTDPERRRRYSESGKKNQFPTEELDDMDGVIVDPAKARAAAREAEHARKEAQELKKISSGIGKVFLQDVEERAKYRQGKWRQGIDPRNASRTASANREPHVPPRYGSPAFACMC